SWPPCRDPGGVSERPKVLASKASEGKTSEGSNPSTTATRSPSFPDGDFSFLPSCQPTLRAPSHQPLGWKCYPFSRHGRPPYLVAQLLFHLGRWSFTRKWLATGIWLVVLLALGAAALTGHKG